MKILLVSVSTSSSQEGGVERHLDYLVELLVGLGYETHLLTTSFRTGKTWSLCPVHTVISPPSFFGPRWWKESRRAFQDLNKRLRFDFIISEGYAAAAIAPLQERSPMAAFLHGFGPEHIMNQWQEVRTIKNLCRYVTIQVPEVLLFSAIEARFCRSIEKIWAVAEHVSQDIQRYYGIPDSRVSVFPNWIDCTFHPAPEDRKRYRSQWNAAPSDVVFLFSSVLSRQKGALIALRAFALLSSRRRDIRLVIVGDGPEYNNLKALTVREGIADRVLLLGHQPHDRMAGILSAADVYLMPTLRIEGLPYAALEAASVGLPAVATPRGGVKDALGEEALYVPAGNAYLMAQAMTLLANDPVERRRRGVAIQCHFMERFTKVHSRQKLHDSLTQLTAHS